MTLIVIDQNAASLQADHAAMPAIGPALAASRLAWSAEHTGGGQYAWASRAADGGGTLYICDDGTLGYDESASFGVWLQTDEEAEEGHSTKWQAEAATMAEAVQLAEAAAGSRAFALGFRRLPTLAELEALAVLAIPLNEDDWGTDRQVDAENLFFDEAAKVAPELDADSGSDFAAFCLKANTEDMLDEALRILRERFAPAPAPQTGEAAPAVAGPNPGDVERLAAAFVAECKATYSGDELAAIRQRNRGYAEAGKADVCATHDFADANEIMLEAFTKTFGRPFAVLEADATEAEHNADAALWGAAWSLATRRDLTEPDFAGLLAATKRLVEAVQFTPLGVRGLAALTEAQIAIAEAEGRT